MKWVSYFDTLKEADLYRLSKIALHDGQVPFSKDFEKLSARAQFLIAARLTRISEGVLGDRKSVGKGITEFRIHADQGLRIYAGRKGHHWFLLAGAGDKTDQKRDIRLCQKRWQQWLKDGGKKIEVENDI